MLESPATDPGRAAEEMQEVRYLRAVIDTLRQELVTERKLVKGFEADLIAARKERDEATRLLRVLNEETVLAGYPCGDRDRTLANVRALRSDLVALAKMYGEACRDLVYARSGEDDLFWQKEEAVVALSRKLVAAEAEAAQLRARLHEAEKGAEAMRDAVAKLVETFPEQILAWYSRGPGSPLGNGYRATTRADLSAAIRGLPLSPTNQEAGDGR